MVISLPTPIPPGAEFQAVLDGTADSSMLDALAASLTDSILDATRLDHIDALVDALSTGPLSTDRRAVLLRVQLAEYRRNIELAVSCLIDIVGSPPNREIVERILAYEWADPELEDPVFEAYLGSIAEPRERAEFAARVAVSYYNVGYEESAELWMDRAVAAHPAPERPEQLRAYLTAASLAYAVHLVR